MQSAVINWVLDVENDAFSDSDRYYTNGTRYSRYCSDKDKLTFNGDVSKTFNHEGKQTEIDGV